jgi:uncharacterized protein (TIGR02453 family)
LIRKSTLGFLKDLSRNNEREWFKARDARYRLALENTTGLFDELIAKLNTHDRIETPSGKRSLYRIHNDARFARDRVPYNPRFAGHFARTKPARRGGYYLWIEPGRSRLGCGFAHPIPGDLRKIRLDILRNSRAWNRLLDSKPSGLTSGPCRAMRSSPQISLRGRTEPAGAAVRSSTM